MISATRLSSVLVAALALFLCGMAHAAAPGITGPTFNLTAQPAYLTQPDGQAIYSWGYGCNGAPTGFAPAAISGGFCNTMQVPGPTLIVTQGQTVTVNSDQRTSQGGRKHVDSVPGFQRDHDGRSCRTDYAGSNSGRNGDLQFVASTPGTHSYYSGTQGDLQVEMGLYGALIVLPNNVSASCTGGLHAANRTAEMHWGEADFRLAAAAYNHPSTCYDREYLFQFSEIDPNIHNQALAQVSDPKRATACSAAVASPLCHLDVPTEPYHPAYFMINGRSMPDDMDPNYAAEYPHQPYNGNPHMHPGEEVLLRIIGQGRWQHPFHEHANHVRILARDGNLILTPDGQALAGPALFTTTTTPGLAMDGIFYYTGRGLNWDMYGAQPRLRRPQRYTYVHPRRQRL